MDSGLRLGDVTTRQIMEPQVGLGKTEVDVVFSQVDKKKKIASRRFA